MSARVWRHCLLLALAASLDPFARAAAGSEPAPRVLFGEDNGFRAATLRTRGVEPGMTEGRLRLELAAADPSGERRSVVFPLRAEEANLSAYRHIEVEIANPGNRPVVFSFWALAGRGWGGVSTYSTSGDATGRETLAPASRAVFRIDLHATYSGAQVYTKAVDPAALRSLELVFEPAGAPSAITLGPIRAIGQAPAEPHDTSRRILVPDFTKGPPAAGRRVFQQLPGWEATRVTHVLTLPRDWAPGRKFPVLVEYTGNVFYHKYCHSTGRTEQGNLAYGLSRGEGFICLNLPFISEDGQREQVDGWGDIDRAVEYCLAALAKVEADYGADLRAVIFTGFSRGSYAANYLALRNDRIAAVWAGFATLRNPGAEWASAKGRGWRGVDAGWNERAARMHGRPWFHQPDELGAEVHVDGEFLEDRPSTLATRRWLEDVVKARTR